MPTVESLQRVSQHRRAVYTALLPYLETPRLMYGMWLWEEEYCGRQDRSLRRFVNEICQGGLSDRALEVYNRLMQHLTDKHVSLEEDPYKMMVAYKNGKLDVAGSRQQGADSVPGATRVFASMLAEMMESLQEEDGYYATQVRVYAGDAVAEYSRGMGLMQVNELCTWFRHGEGTLQCEYSVEQMRYVLHLVYMGSCEFFGPVKTDRWLSQTVQAVSGSPEARGFAPQQLL